MKGLDKFFIGTLFDAEASGRRTAGRPQAAAAGRPQATAGRAWATRIAGVLPRGEAEEARRDVGGIKKRESSPRPHTQ